MNEIRIRWKNQVPPTLPGGGFQFYDHDLGWTAMTVVEAREATDRFLVRWE